MLIRAMEMAPRVDGLREITMDMRRPEPGALVNCRVCRFRVIAIGTRGTMAAFLDAARGRSR